MIEQLEELMTSPVFLELAGAIAAAIWLKLKHSETKAARIARTIDDAVGSSVTKVYHDYVRDIKTARADGKLTVKEAEHARASAVRAAIEMARGRGVELADEVEPQHLTWLIERAVSAWKGDKNDEPTRPSIDRNR